MRQRRKRTLERQHRDSRLVTTGMSTLSTHGGYCRAEAPNETITAEDLQVVGARCPMVSDSALNTRMVTRLDEAGESP